MTFVVSRVPKPTWSAARFGRPGIAALPVPDETRRPLRLAARTRRADSLADWTELRTSPELVASSWTIMATEVAERSPTRTRRERRSSRASRRRRVLRVRLQEHVEDLREDHGALCSPYPGWIRSWAAESAPRRRLRSSTISSFEPVLLDAMDDSAAVRLNRFLIRCCISPGDQSRALLRGGGEIAHQ